MGLPLQDTAYARSRLGTAEALWDNKTELAAQQVEYLQFILKALGADFEVQHVPRPYDNGSDAEVNEPAATASDIMDFLKGI